jgi:hypothetical protein
MTHKLGITMEDSRAVTEHTRADKKIELPLS